MCNKKITKKKNPVISRKCCVFWVFLQMRWNVKGGKQDFSNKEIVLNAASVLIFQGNIENKFQKYTIPWFQLLHTHTYIIGHYSPSVRIIDLVSHTTYIVCVNCYT